MPLHRSDGKRALVSTDGLPNRRRSRSLRQFWQAAVRRFLWRMDIAPDAWIHPTALIDRTWPRGVHIRSGGVIGPHAVILTHDMSRGLYLDTTLEEGVRIGARAIIFPGVTLGMGCTVMPGAVVTQDVAAGTNVGGNPAREIASGKV